MLSCAKTGVAIRPVTTSAESDAFMVNSFR
jgi:hypothetical protein